MTSMPQPQGVTPDHAALMREALRELDRLQAHVDRLEQAGCEPIAVVGMDCRFPAFVDGPAAFWKLLETGGDAITEVPRSRWDIAAVYDPDPATPGKMATRFGGFLPDIDQFDPAFFRMSPRDASNTDPQHRLALEVAWGALEDAGLPPRDKSASTGVFLGITMSEYGQVLLRAGGMEALGPHSAIGVSLNAAAGRIAYLFGLRGPCMAVDTACSSSLVAVHLACQSLRARECDRALAGGVNAILLPESTIATSRARMLAPDGRCKTFDARANGYVRSDGCGMVVLKRLSDAIEQRDRILGLIRGSAVNQDGPSGGLTVPSGPAQEDVIRRALRAARLRPETVSYVEAHGTGTALGDVIEMSALQAVYGAGREADRRVLVGAAKTNIGHAESAAGIAGLIKVLLCLRHEKIPPNLHLTQPAPGIPWAEIGLRVADGTHAWPRTDRSRIAGISSFGFSGTNCHLIVEEAQRAAPSAAFRKLGAHLLTLSSTSDALLRATSRDYASCLVEPGAPDGEAQGIPFSDACYTACTGRVHRRHRLAVVAVSANEASETLTRFTNNDATARVAHGEADPEEPEIAFLFSGQGAQHAGMGRALFESQPVFRRVVEECDALLRPHLPKPLIDVMYRGDATEHATIHETLYAQAALFALGYALAGLWTSWGVVPALLIGHSIGEYAAACIAGVLTLEDAARLVAERGRLMQAVGELGGMAAVLADEATVRRAVAGIDGALSIAAVNAPENIVLSGAAKALEEALARLARQGVRTQRLQVSHAFHSPLMEPAAEAFLAKASGVKFAVPRRRVISTVTGTWAGDEFATPEYWARQIIAPVNFAGAVRCVPSQTRVFLEIGPGSTLLSLAKRCIARDSAAWIPSLRPGQSDHRPTLEALAQLYVKGAPIDWDSVHSHAECSRCELPRSRMQRARYWAESAASPRVEGTGSPMILPDSGSILGERVDVPGGDEIRFEARYGMDGPDMVRDHRLFDAVVVPAASYIAMVIAASVRTRGSPMCELKDLVFGQALVVGAQGPCRVHLVMSGDERERLRIYARSASGSDGEWALHAEGLLGAPRSDNDAAVQSNPALAFRGATGGHRVPGARLYKELRSNGYNLGPSFQWIAEVHVHDTEAIGRIEQPSCVETSEEYPLHPGLIDSCFQTLAAAAAAGTPENALYVPFRMDRFLCFRTPQSRQMWCIVSRRIADRDRVVADIRLFDQAGSAVASVEGFEARIVSRAHLLGAVAYPALPVESFLMAPQWIPSGPANSANVASFDRARKWLIIGEESPLALDLAERIRGRGAECSLDSEWDSEPATSLLRGENGDHVANRREAVDGIVYLLGLADADAELSTAELESHQQCRCAGLLQLVQDIAPLEKPSRLWVVTRGAQAAGGDDRVLVHEAPLWGLSGVARVEMPEMHCTRIDLDPEPQRADADEIFAELAASDEFDTVAYRSGRRHVLRLTPVDHDGSVSRGSGAPIVRDDGTYLVTGGFGALGGQMAGWLVARGARTVALAGRHPDSEAAKKIVRTLEAAGARVLAIAADIANPRDVESLMACLAAAPPLRGIIHAAGVLDDGPLTTLNWERVARVQGPKVAGAWNLHLATRHLALDCFISFSSAAVWFASPGQGSYASANAFLDALASHRRAMGLKGTSINWGPWAGDGMVGQMRNEWRVRLERNGMRLLTAEVALEALESILARDMVQAGVLSVDWSRLAGGDFAGAAPAAIRHLIPAARVSGTDRTFLTRVRAAEPAVRRLLFQEHVVAAVADVLGLDAGRLDAAAGFFDMGMDSLSAIELRNQLRATLGHEFPATLTFKYTNTNALVEGVLHEMGFEEPMPTASRRTIDTQADDVRRLSASELESIVDDEFNRLMQRTS